MANHSDAVLERVEADVAAGNWRLAAHRLRGHLVDQPDCDPARNRLVEIYRAAGHPQEAGRWGYLLKGIPTAAELAAFESACSARLAPDWTATMMRRAIFWPTGRVPRTGWAAQGIADLDTRAARELSARQLANTPSWRRWIRFLVNKWCRPA